MTGGGGDVGDGFKFGDVMVVVVVPDVSNCKDKRQRRGLGRMTHVLPIIIPPSLPPYPPCLPSCIPVLLTPGCSLTISGSLGKSLTPPVGHTASTGIMHAKDNAQNLSTASHAVTFTQAMLRAAVEPLSRLFAASQFRCSVYEAVIAQRLLISITLATSTLDFKRGSFLLSPFFLNTETLFIDFKGLGFFFSSMGNFEFSCQRKVASRPRAKAGGV